jgi:mono/diheme cytochrome c family protein
LSAALFAGGCGRGQTAAPPDTSVTYPDPGYKAGMTYYKDVLPITQVACQGCHTTGGIGPFPLLTVGDAQTNAAAMAAAVQARTMPPWMPSSSCQDFQNARVLTQDQVNTIYSWQKDGAAAGSPTDAPPPPTAPTGLPWVDRTLTPTAAYNPNSAISDDYHCFVLDPKLATDQTLIGYDFQPGVRSEVHHVLIYSTPLAAAQANDAATPEVGYTCFGGPNVSSQQLVAAWVPGTSATQFPPNTGVSVKAGSGLVMQVHYNLVNGVAPDTSSLKLQFAKTPVSRLATLTPLAQTKFLIPPKSVGYTASNSLVTPAPLTLWGIAPHMHTLGRQAVATVTPPGGASSCLIDIPKWNFHWQQFYFYSAPNGVQIPAGSTIKFSCTWDNAGSTGVQWGESTSDEMCITYFYITTP